MAQEHLSTEFARRLREYFMHTKHLRATKRDHQLLENMSSALQAEVTWKVNEKWLRRVPFLRDACMAFLVQLSLHLHPHVFAPHELCPLELLYILHRGLALYEGKLLGAGSVWGEDVILTSSHLKSSHHARALTFLDVLTIDHNELDQIAADFPETTSALLAIEQLERSGRAALEGRSPPPPRLPSRPHALDVTRCRGHPRGGDPPRDAPRLRAACEDD